MISTSRRRSRSTDIWPGFVDVLATVVLVFVFLLMLFVVSQFYLSDVLFERHRALETLQTRVTELAETLSMREAEAEDLRERVQALSGRLQVTLAEREQLQQSVDQSQAELRQQAETLEAHLLQIASLQEDIDALRRLREDLESQVGRLASELEESQASAGQLRDRSRALEARLAETQETTLLAQREIEAREIRIQDLAAGIEERDRALVEERSLTADAQARVDALRRQMQDLEQQLARLNETLRAREETIEAQQVEIADLGERLNLALAEEVRELSRYRSEFFGRLREVLSDVEDIQIVGDRFRFQSELFFETASADIGPEGRERLDRVARTIREIDARIPGDIGWVLMVEGHTDRRPIRTEQFPSNWELSSARAQSIVNYLISRGVAPRRLAAAGFGEYHPLDAGSTEAAFSRNRRIEMRLSSAPN
ncbi:peptidoglycan -binding protein [Thioalkalivibrio sulfidiphilus]|uniref:OmpA/MotB domain-containing protein n=1 Tax=Thioalkalivibrio sulfidiphilus (strain HL-EbGR7) TaxID=396588 RepID=B8GUM1_THISH|nr:peptidoglycan -binding protein [Thioalkalivibrio sulfidiphilus]ACL73341.1 OmpA/MotB domain-containing protein [Thioalkalivibrio sulfidiphilus HL-EbGr7]